MVHGFVRYGTDITGGESLFHLINKVVSLYLCKDILTKVVVPTTPRAEFTSRESGKMMYAGRTEIPFIARKEADGKLT